jgi:drug/metabolite transporter (DMT)-like permease
MAAVLGGLGAAIIWAAGSIGASRAARGLGPMLTLAWVMLIGLVVTGVILPFSGHVSLTATALLWLILGGTGNVGGLLLMYRALRLGQMGVVMPIVTTEGGITAVVAIVAGQSVTAGEGAALATTLVGVILIAAARRTRGEPVVAAAAGPELAHPRAVANPTGHGDRRAAAWATLAAVTFGVGLYGTGRAGVVLPAAWAALPPRVVGVTAVTIPLALSRRLGAPHGFARWLLLSGVCEVGGFLAYAVGARHSIAIAAVLATLAGAFGVAIGRVLFGERLRTIQLVGAIVTLAGVATLSALTA